MVGTERTQPARPDLGATPRPSLTTFESTDPRTGRVVGVVEAMDADAVDRSLDRAATLASEWSAVPVADRARHLRRVRRHWVRRSSDLVDLVVAETGKPSIDALYEVLAGAVMLDWCSWNARRALRPRRLSTFPLLNMGARVEYSPYGIVAVIAPWNYPAGIAMQVLPWAIAAGNVVVLKPSELTPLTGQLIGEIVNEAGHPLVEVVTGDHVAGDALAGSPKVGKIEFTGSGSTARHVLGAAARHITPVVMELGGKDAMIVTGGADVRAAARTAVAGAFFNAGQTCMAVERVIATPDVHDRLVDEIVDCTKTLRVGPGPSCHVGPLSQSGAIERLERRVAAAVAAGARVATGGRRAPGLAGDFYEPTVLLDVPHDAEIVREENFAPVMSILAVRDQDEAVALANDVELGLSSSVFAGSRREARSVASRLDTGGTIVGDAMVGAGIPGLPFGGEKRSGYGRLQGIGGFHEFSRRRVVVERRFGPPMMATMAHARPDPATVQRLARAVLGGGGLAERVRALRDH